MPIKEVRLGPQSSDVRVEPQELQQSPRAAFLHPDDESLGQPARGRPLLPRAVGLRRGVAAPQRVGSVPLLPPSRRPREEVARGRLDFRVLSEVRLAASSEKVDQGEADDAQRGGDGEPVEEPPQVGARGVEVMLAEVVVVVAVVKGCHPSAVSATWPAILPRNSAHILTPGEALCHCAQLLSTSFMLCVWSAPSSPHLSPSFLSLTEPQKVTQPN